MEHMTQHLPFPPFHSTPQMHYPKAVGSFWAPKNQRGQTDTGLPLAAISVNLYVAFPRLFVLSGSIRLILCHHLQARGRTSSFLKKLLAAGNAASLGLGSVLRGSICKLHDCPWRCNLESQGAGDVWGWECHRGMDGGSGEWGYKGAGPRSRLGCWRPIGIIEEKAVSPCLATWVSSWLC